ncbi:MAG: hypothetical protein ACLFWM_10000 [Actinomycetota bacterium]
MSRLKPLILIVAAAAALAALLRSGRGGTAPTDRGGWKAVDPE